MAWYYNTRCPFCGKEFHVEECPMGVAGGKDKEDIDCPWCRKTVDQKMTDGWIIKTKIE